MKTNEKSIFQNFLNILLSENYSSSEEISKFIPDKKLKDFSQKFSQINSINSFTFNPLLKNQGNSHFDSSSIVEVNSPMISKRNSHCNVSLDSYSPHFAINENILKNKARRKSSEGIYSNKHINKVYLLEESFDSKLLIATPPIQNLDKNK